MNERSQGIPVSGFVCRPCCGLWTSGFGHELKTFLCSVILSAAFHPSPLRACAACYGQSDSPMAKGMNWGIFSLLVVVVLVLGGIASFFVYLARRSAVAAGISATAPSPTAINASWPGRRGALGLRRSILRKHWIIGSFLPARRGRARCARGQVNPDSVAFEGTSRKMGPQSGNPIL